MSMLRRTLISGEWFKSPVDESKPNYTGTGQNYFDSFESCYALLATAGSLLIDDAHALGITTEGKSREAIARELFERGFTPPNKDA